MTRYYTGSSNSAYLQGSGPTTTGHRSNISRSRPGLLGGKWELRHCRRSSPLRASILRPTVGPERHLRLSRLAFRRERGCCYLHGRRSRTVWRGSQSRGFRAQGAIDELCVLSGAIFEGFQAHLWTKNSGRLLWMTHPRGPAIPGKSYSSDYDTGAAYYAVKKGLRTAARSARSAGFRTGDCEYYRAWRSLI